MNKKEGVTYRISHKNINKLNFDSPQNFDSILFDSNLNCNLHCVYCHNPRDLEKVNEEDFERFIETCVKSVKLFQIGCAMEPTMDKRMTWFALKVKNSKANPTNTFRLQTNGILLDKHNIDHLREAGINRFTISMDTINSEIHKELRGGSDLSKILKNIEWLKSIWPEACVNFVCTVTTLNLPHLQDLVDFASKNNINYISFRKMFYFPDSKIIKNHDKMKELFLDNNQYLEKINQLNNNKNVTFFIHDENSLENNRNLVKV